MENLQPGQIVQLNGKDATVITVGDGVVHLEQDGESISVHPNEVTVPDASVHGESVQDEPEPKKENGQAKSV